MKVLEFVDRWSRDQKSCSSWVILSVSSASATVIEPSKGANDWECVDKNLQKLNFGVVFAEVNECCSTKQSFYACIRQHLLDEETNICYITLGVLVDLINYFKRLNRWTNISGVFWVTVVFLQLKLNICLRYSVRQFNFIITTAGCLEIELQESWTNTDFWEKNSNWLIVVFKRSDKITATHDLSYFLLKFTKLLKAFITQLVNLSNQIQLCECASYSYCASSWRQQTNPFEKKVLKML